MARKEIAALVIPFDAQKQQISVVAGKIFLIFTGLCAGVFGRALQKIGAKRGRRTEQKEWIDI